MPWEKGTLSQLVKGKVRNQCSTSFHYRHGSYQPFRNLCKESQDALVLDIGLYWAPGAHEQSPFPLQQMVITKPLLGNPLSQTKLGTLAARKKLTNHCTASLRGFALLHALASF